MAPGDLIEALWEARATAILRTDDQQIAHDAMDAAVRGGFRFVEFTLTCPEPYELIAEFARRPDLVVGAGTVLRPDQARRAIEAGARFIVSPVVDEEVIGEALAGDVAAIPGVYSPSEMVRAHRAGARLQKLFPAPARGPEYVRACLGPMPFLRLVPTHGVDPDNVGAWIAAGVWAVGFVGSLFEAEALRTRNYERIEQAAGRCLAAAAAAARPPERRPHDPFAGGR